jgi:hypothetical protein
MTFYTWLKDQPADFQDVAIGTENAKKLRSGEMTQEQFDKQNLGKTFAPMTLSEKRVEQSKITARQE